MDDSVDPNELIKAGEIITLIYHILECVQNEDGEAPSLKLSDCGNYLNVQFENKNFNIMVEDLTSFH